MGLKPRVSPFGEEGLRSLLLLSPSPPSSSPLPILARLTLHEEEYSDSDSESDPSFPKINPFYSKNGASSSTTETTSEGSSVADPVEQTQQINVGSPKDWTFRSFESIPTKTTSGRVLPVAVPVEETDRIYVGSQKDSIFMPFVASPGGNISDPLELEEVRGRAGVVPMARVSMEFDDEEEGLRVIEEIEEEEGFVARVPGFGIADQEEDRGEGNEPQPKVKCEHDGGSEKLEVNGVSVGEVLVVNDSTLLSSSNFENEMSESDGDEDDLSAGMNSYVVNVGEDLSAKVMIGSCVSGNGYGVEKIDEILPLKVDAVESSMEEEEDAASFEPVRVKEVDSRVPSSGLVSVPEVVVLQGLSVKENPLMEVGFDSSVEEVVFRDLDVKEESNFTEKTEVVGIDSSGYVDCMVSSSDQNLIQPESLILESIELIDVLEDESASWVSSLAADIEKIVVCDGNADQCLADEIDAEVQQLVMLSGCSRKLASQEDADDSDRKNTVVRTSVPRNGIILDFLLHSLKLVSSNLEGEARPQKSLRIREDGDEGVIIGIKVPYQPGSPSLVEFGGSGAIAANLRPGFSLGRRSSRFGILVGWMDKQRWKITIRTSSSDGLQASVFGIIIPVAVSVFRIIFRGQGSKASST